MVFGRTLNLQDIRFRNPVRAGGDITNRFALGQTEAPGFNEMWDSFHSRNPRSLFLSDGFRATLRPKGLKRRARHRRFDAGAASFSKRQLLEAGVADFEMTTHLERCYASTRLGEMLPRDGHSVRAETLTAGIRQSSFPCGATK